MVLKLSQHPTLKTELPAIALSTLDAAREALLAEELAFDVRVHEARKHLKRVRALVRLLRKELGKDVRKRDDAALAKAMRALAGPREEAAELEALHALVTRSAGVLKEHADTFVVAAAQVPAGDVPADREQAIGNALEALSAVRGGVDSWALTIDGWDVVGPGFKKTAGRARSAFERAKEHASASRLHSWRQHLKRHQYQLELLSPLRPKPIGARLRQAARAAELLGEDHDLALLSERLDKVAESSELRRTRRALSKAIAARRRAVQRKALRIGNDLHRESAAHLARTYASYFEKAKLERSDAEQEPAPGPTLRKTTPEAEIAPAKVG